MKRKSIFAAIALMMVCFLSFGLVSCGKAPSKPNSNKPDSKPAAPSTLVVGQYEDGSQFAGNYYVQMGSYPQTKCELSAPQLVSGKTYNFMNQENEVYTDGTDEYVKYNNEYFKIEPVRWVVIGNENGGKLASFDKDSKGTYTVISEKILVQQIFNKESKLNNKWNGSDMQTFMNENLFNDLFTAEEKAVIKNTILTTTYKAENGAIEDTTTAGDKMFLLGMKDQTTFGDSEVREDTFNVDLIEQLLNNNNQVCQGGKTYDSLKAYKTDLAQATGCYGANGETGYWWLRSGDYEQGDSVGQIMENGAVNTNSVHYTTGGIRAAFRITL